MRKIIILVALASACSDSPPPQASAAAGQAAPLGIDPAAMDMSVDPCTDFYTYACGTWLKNTTIPADRTYWARGFSTIAEQNETLLHGKLDELAAGKLQIADESRKANLVALSKYWGACNDEAAIEANAKGELEALLKPVNALKNNGDELAKLLVQLHQGTSSPFFDFASTQDFKDSSVVTGEVDQGGLGLPEKDFYFRTDEKSQSILKGYQAHVQRMFELAGVAVDKAKKEADAAFKIELALAKASQSRVDRRDPAKLYHRIELAGVEKAAPKFNWKLYLKESGQAGLTKINVVNPDYLKAFNEIVAKTPLDQIKSYLRWHVIHDVAGTLNKAIVEEHFAFYGKTLFGTPELKPRWRRCYDSSANEMGEALTALYIDVAFSSQAREQTIKLIQDVEAAMDRNIDGLQWMDAETKAAAKVKLKGIGNMIGHPEKLRDYSSIALGGSYTKNKIATEAFETKRQIAKIGQPVAKDEWLIAAHEVNAYYYSPLNQIVFPAGILQPPFYSTKAQLAVNYGAIGLVMGHEITHGFDDSGRQFDAQGNLRDWWTEASAKEYTSRTQCLKNQYSEYIAVDDVKVNGELTLGENIADLSGLKLAFSAYQAARGATSATPAGSQWSDDQLFFLGHAQAWCTVMRPETTRTLAQTDPHSPAAYRVNGPFSNMPEFAKTYSCQAGKPMVRAEQCSVW